MINVSQNIGKKEQIVTPVNEAQSPEKKQHMAATPTPSPKPKPKAPATKTATAKSQTKTKASPGKKQESPISLKPALQLSVRSPNKSPTKRQSPSLPLSFNKKQPSAKIDILDAKKAEAVINKTFLAKDIPRLTSIIDDLKTTRADQIFKEYKASTEVRLKTSDDLISTLSAKNNALAMEVQELKVRLRDSEHQQVPMADEEEQYQNQLILDMIEQIVGLRIHRAEETDNALSFDCSQSGKNGILDYKLTIPKEDSSEIIYTPMNSAEEVPQLKTCLPDYFFDNLTFPLDTLQQFYHKIYRGLNK